MPIVSRHAPGTFCWAELYTTDQAGAKAFYGGLFGWGVRDIPTGPGAGYTIFTLEGRSAAACYGALPEMETKGIPPHWLPYVAVTSSDETAAKVKAAGGTVLKEPFDIPGTGRMAALADPSGAAFCVWEEKGQPGIGVHREPGALHWVELLASDTDRASAFYASVFGWTRVKWPDADAPTYHLFQLGEAMAGGMLAIVPGMKVQRSAWGLYFNVSQCDAAVVRAVGLGGRVTVAPKEYPEAGRFAIVADPAGSQFGLITPPAV